MCEVYDLPMFMTLPRSLSSPDKVSRHYARMKNRLDFMVQHHACTRDQYDEWLAVLDSWLPHAIARTQEEV